MNIISMSDIVECNGMLKDQDLQFRIHLRDACGKQSCYIEPMGDCACGDADETLYTFLEEYFKKKRFTLEYSEDKMNFWLMG